MIGARPHPQFERLMSSDFSPESDPTCAPEDTFPSDPFCAPLSVAAQRYTPSGRPRWWTAIAIIFVSGFAFLIASGIMTVVAFAVVHGEINASMFAKPNAMRDVLASRIGLLLMVVTPQLMLVIPSIVAAQLSPVESRRRLGLVRGNWPVWTWFAAAAATPLVGLASSVVVGQFMTESASLKMMSEIFRAHGQAGFLIPLALMIGATPAICEELLFRGYVQTRLTKSFGPAAGILVASVFFAAFHMDFVHVIAVLPLGLFLGWVAWRSASLYPAMIGHFVNNVISVVAVVYAPEDKTDVLAVPAMIVSLSIIGLGMMGMSVVVVASILYGRPDAEIGPELASEIDPSPSSLAESDVAEDIQTRRS